jgi:hypothetical protein
MQRSPQRDRPQPRDAHNNPISLLTSESPANSFRALREEQPSKDQSAAETPVATAAHDRSASDVRPARERRAKLAAKGGRQAPSAIPLDLELARKEVERIKAKELRRQERARVTAEIEEKIMAKVHRSQAARAHAVEAAERFERSQTFDRLLGTSVRSD